MKTQTMSKIQRRQEKNFDVGLIKDFCTPEEASDLFETLEKEVKWRPKNRTGRLNQSYGDDGFEYTLNIRGNKTVRKTISWDQLSPLKAIRDRLSATIGSSFTYCVVLRYPSGKIGIKPHQDRELKKGTIIAGLSLGTTRTLTLTPLQRNRKKFKIQVPPGSVYLLYPPTNEYWLHSIEKDESDSPRISVTFRQY